MAYRITDANVRKKGFSKSSRESVPIGGGDCGANVWLEEDSRLHLLLSKTDSFGESGRLMKTGYITVQVPGIFSKENLPELELDLTDGCAVSYTHLDVYKRQVRSRVSSSFSGSRTEGQRVKSKLMPSIGKLSIASWKREAKYCRVFSFA